MATQRLQLESFVAGDHWSGIPNVSIAINGSPPSSPLALVRMRFRQAKTAYVAPVVEITSATSSILIANASQWIFSIKKQPMPGLTDGLWDYNIETTSIDGVVSTYIEGSIIVKKDI